MFLGTKPKFTIGQRVRIKDVPRVHFFPVDTIVEIKQVFPPDAVFSEIMYDCINPLDCIVQTVKESEIEAVVTDSDDAWDRSMGIL